MFYMLLMSIKVNNIKYSNTLINIRRSGVKKIHVAKPAK